MIPDWFPELAAAVLAAVLAITLHEAAHGFAALALGDDTAKRAGRLSLNPLRHVDPVGTVLLPGVLVVGQLIAVGQVQAVFGWAKPVPVNIWNLRHPRQGMMLVAAAGPATNFVLAWLAGLSAHPLAAFSGSLPPEALAFGLHFVGIMILANLVLGLFNLLPIPPLDGGRILVGLLPAGLALRVARIEPYGILIVLLSLFLLPQLLPAWDPMGWFLRAVVAPAFDLVLMLSGHGGGS